jgi:SAM-dependent methyltransferase
MTDEILIAGVESYYSDKVTRFGATPRGVDWNSEEGQRLRFERLLVALDVGGESMSINDYGCGYGSLLDLLIERGVTFRYTGYDLSKPMVRAAQKRHGARADARFVSQHGDLEVADFTVASGIFNVRLGQSDDAWRRYVLETIDDMVALSDRGVAFNALTSHSDPSHMRADLYYADPAFLVNHCLTRYSRNVALDHDYELYEFTLAVRLDRRPPATQPMGGSIE